MKRLTKAATRTAINLLFFTVIGTAILAATYLLTHERIEQTEKSAKLKLINQVAPSSLYDNELLDHAFQLAASEQLGTQDSTTAYHGTLRGKPSIIVLEAIAPDGYSGKINLLLAITHDGQIKGVRVISHKETPGLGDYIEIAKNKWITLFDDSSHQRYPETDWKVKKDGGRFDYMAGATITPRAVIKAVHKALHFVEENREQLFSSTPTTPAEGK